MTRAGEKITLTAFLANADEAIAADISEALQAVQARLTDLKRALRSEPTILAQVEKLASTLPLELVASEFSERQSAARVAARLIEDLKERWIAADNPPLVNEIDSHFRELTAWLVRIRQPGRQQLHSIAAQMDQLAAPNAALDGIERRYLPWALGGLAMFIVGLFLLFSPSILSSLHTPQSFVAILTCLCALPAVGVHYALAIRPRTRTDQKVDALNREHFLPRGGLYFPAGENPAGVVLVDWQRPEPEDPHRLKDPRKDKNRPGATW